MKQLVIFILYGCIMSEYFCGPVISDPAPGRSPGPPRIDNTISLLSSLDTQQKINEPTNSDELIKDTATNYENNIHYNENENDGREETIRAQKFKDVNPNFIQKIDFENNDNISFYSQHPSTISCSNIKKFLKENDIIFKDKDNDYTKLPYFDVIHDVFTTEKGIMAGIKYKVEISKMNELELNEFFIESYIDDERPRGHFLNRNKLVINTETSFDQQDGDTILSRSLTSYIGDIGPNDSFNLNYVEDDVGSKEEYENYNDECKKNVWIDDFDKSNHLSMNWRLNDNLDEEGDGADNTTVYFRLLYRKSKNNIVYEVIFKYPLLRECKVYLKHNVGRVDNLYLPSSSLFNNCSMVFPDVGKHDANSSGISVELTRLNVACKSGGYLKFNRYNNRSICGKLEELDDRTFYFPLNNSEKLVLSIIQNPIFEIKFKLIDFCYNMTLSDENHLFIINEYNYKELECNIRIHIPFGNIIVFNVIINDSNSSDRTLTGDDANFKIYNFTLVDRNNNYLNKIQCDSPIIEIIDYYSNKNWRQCLNDNSDKKVIRRYSITSSGNILEIKLLRKLYHKSNINNNIISNNYNTTIQLSYNAQPIETIVSQCAFGSIAVNQFCISLFDSLMLSWYDAELSCNNRGGHLLSIRSDNDQNLIENYIMNSPRYNEYSSYWIGASDKNFEGDYRWSDGFPFSYSNWFPGWSSYDNYNKQPNDDGLSAQDCVELRKFFQQPTGNKAQIRTAFAKTLMWNDRDCETKNYFICESLNNIDDQLEKPVIQDCNRSVELSHELPKITIWSPGYPKYYPDNMNCFTLISSPPGYRITIDFEELIIENEPQCAYDYLIMFEPKLGFHSRTPRHSNNNRTSYRRNQYQSNKEKGSALTQTFLVETSQKYLVNFPGASSYNSVSSTSDTVLENKLSRRICGDWSSKIKLLRYITKGQSLGVNFVTDYSHHFVGYKAKVAIESVDSECSDDRLKFFNGSCYLFISFPEVDWQTAQRICSNIGAQLTSISSMEEQRFIISNIRNHIDYTPRALYWLGGALNQNNGKFEWHDGSSMNFQGWLPGRNDAEKKTAMPLCMGIQWTVSPTPMLTSGLYWQSHKCLTPGGYVCKRIINNSADNSVRNNTIIGRDGRITSPNYPNKYNSNIDYWVRIKSPETNSRIILQFQRIDIEYQEECLYDSVSIENIKLENNSSDNHQNHNNSKRSLRSFAHVQNLNNQSNEEKLNYPLFLTTTKLCGVLETNMSQYDFISQSNEVKIHFHSDYSLSYTGFSATWTTVDLSGCPIKTLTSREGYIASPNFPYFLLNNLNCSFVIQAPKGKIVWLEFTHYDIGDSASVQIDNGFGNSFSPFEIPHHVNDGIYLSKNEKFLINLQTDGQPRGKGFRASFKTSEIKEQRNIYLINSTEKGLLLNLNYPQQLTASFIDFTQHLIAPLGEVILLELYGVGFTNDANDGCRNNSFIEIIDNYADTNGTTWVLCKLTEETQYEKNMDPKSSYSAEYKLIENHLAHAAPIYIISYLNTLHVRQKSFRENIKLNATVRLQTDINYKMKLISTEDWVETCDPNPCQFGGKCLTSDEKKVCQCRGHYAGRFCRLNLCEFEPCLFGKCELTTNSFKCHCQPGYSGRLCDQKQKPCAENPCESRGECFEKNGVFACRCHAWWEGQRCEKRMTKIPFKPLSERMLQEPFWLGLITVFFVLAIIGLVWCAKRHFPEKIEKLLADEADRSRSTSVHSSHHYHHHNSSLREQLQASAGTISSSTVTTPGAPKSIFGRLGIRKPSILSLSSPQPVIGGSTTARTFSLDDLLRPPPRRTPSPRKKRNNSTPSKKNPAEKKQILQQLISSASQNQPRINLEELIHLSENQNSVPNDSDSNKIKETSLIENNNIPANVSIKRQISDPKLEKKVTFARLLSKVSAEMNSSSEIEMGHGNKTSSALSLPVEVTQRANSVPPSPCTNDMRSPCISTSSNPGFDSLSSSELALNECGYKNNSLTKTNRRIRSKMTSADSILAMFKNYTISNGGISLNSSSPIILSPSTTPDELIVGDDESSTSSIHTPVSCSSGPPDSPIFYRQNKIEVPVLDVINVHNNNNNLSPSSSSSSSINTTNNSSSYPLIHLEIPNMNNKCLSPIRELPTPIPSPALTPIMSRLRTKSILHDETMCVVTLRNEKEDDIHKTDIHSKPHIVIDMLPEIIICDAFDTSQPAIKKNYSSFPCCSSISIDVQPPTPEKAKRPHDLIIPAVKIDEPSPTNDKKPYFIFPGSPPPHRSSKKSQTSFEKPSSLDLPFIPPTIVIDEVVGPDINKLPYKNASNNNNNLGNGVVMCYLSPFSICAREDRAPSESNLSSSGYSSMASPGPSRCGSNNPLYPSGDIDDNDPASTSAHAVDFRLAIQHVRNSRDEKTYKNDRKDSNSNIQSDSETLSNDEGIGTDHLEEKTDEKESRLRELEQSYVDDNISYMSQLQIPTVTIQKDIATDKLSPVSSRSESPLSIKRFSTSFYCKKDQQLLFTDSDGLYDFPSSDGKGSGAPIHQRKTSGKKRERKISRSGLLLSPTKVSSKIIDIPKKDGSPSHFGHLSTKHATGTLNRKNPKRRTIYRQPIASSSSSTESLTHDVTQCMIKAPIIKQDIVESPDYSEDETIADAQTLPKPLCEEHTRTHNKLSKLRAIGHQIRFLKRLEKSIQKRNKSYLQNETVRVNTEDEFSDGVMSPKITSPLLQDSNKMFFSNRKQKEFTPNTEQNSMDSDF